MTVILDLIYCECYKNDYGDLVIDVVADIEGAGPPDYTSEIGEYQVGRKKATFTLADYEGDPNLSDEDVKKILEDNDVNWCKFESYYDD
jgi:hypothetical protein